MNISYNINTPEILSLQLKLDTNQKRRMIETILFQKDTADYHGGYTYEIQDNNFHDFSNLYNFFYRTVENIFGKMTHSCRHKHWCWANVYNKDNFKTNLHDHLATSSINAIFYLNMPEEIKSEEGGLKFLNLRSKEFFIFYPSTFDLLIMPSYIPHEPLYHSSSQYRIAINMEISILEDIEIYYNLGNIYAKCSPII